MITVLLKKNLVFSLGKRKRKGLCNITILGNYEKPTSQEYFEAFFESTTIDWKDIYLFSRKTSFNTNAIQSFR